AGRRRVLGRDRGGAARPACLTPGQPLRSVTAKRLTASRPSASSTVSVATTRTTPVATRARVAASSGTGNVPSRPAGTATGASPTDAPDARSTTVPAQRAAARAEHVTG